MCRDLLDFVREHSYIIISDSKVSREKPHWKIDERDPSGEHCSGRRSVGLLGTVNEARRGLSAKSVA